MAQKIIDTLVENLKLAKEANDLTVANIKKIISDASSDIVKEIEFDKAMINESVKEVIDSSTSTLEALQSDTTENIKAAAEAALDGVKNVVESEISEKKETMRTIYQNVEADIKNEIKDTISNVQSFADRSIDIVKHAADGALKGIQEALDEQNKRK